MTKLKSPYILLIILLLGAFLIFSVWSAFQAATYGSQVSDPDYYSKGLKYNNTRIEERAAASQGWRLETEIDQNQLRFKLFDLNGQPISQAVGGLTLYLNQQNRVQYLIPVELQPGTYQIDLPDKIHGSFQARIEFELLGARISRRLLVNL